MMTYHEQQLRDLACASSASGTIIEAHSDHGDNICRIVIDMGEGLRNLQLREAILQLWMADGFIASTSRDGAYLMIDGWHHADESVDLIAAVAQQIKRYTQSAMQRESEEINVELAHLASTLTGAEQTGVRS